MNAVPPNVLSNGVLNNGVLSNRALMSRAFATYDRGAETARIEAEWQENPRWQGITRTYSADDVVRLRGSIVRDNTIAKLGAEKLRDLLANAAVSAQSATAGCQATQQIEAGAQAIYLSISQAIANHTAETIRPDQSLYAINSIPSLVRRINNAFERADQIQWKAGAAFSDNNFVDYFAPIVADAEAPHDSALNAFELTKNMIRAGAAAVRFGDRSDNVLMSTREVVQKLCAARLAADVEDVSTVIIAHTTANTTTLLSSADDAADRAFVNGECTEEGFYPVRADIEHAIARGLAYAPHADLLWFETAQPDLAAARQFAAAIRSEYPEQMLAYSTSAADLGAAQIEQLQGELAALGYRFQFLAAEMQVACEDDELAA